MSCTCQKCGSKYKVDVLVPDEVWQLITKSNLLCPTCIFELIQEHFGYSAWDVKEIK